MAEESILQYLLQGGQPNPAAAFMANAFLQGRLPGNPVVNEQTILSMLSSQEPGLTDLLGISPEQAAQAKEVALGLAPTASQELLAQVQGQQALARYLQTMATLAQGEEGLKIKRRQAAVQEKEHERKVAEGQARMQQLQSLANSLDELAATRRQTRMFRNMAATGIGANGEPLSKEERDIAMRMAKVYPEDPLQMQLAKALIYSGVEADRKLGAQILAKQLGMETEAERKLIEEVARPSFWDKIFPGAPLPMEEILPPASEGGISPSEQRALDEELEQFKLNLKDLLEEEK